MRKDEPLVRAEGWEPALEEIVGTVCGRPFEFDRLPASRPDGAAATNACLQALDEEPAVIVGIPSSTAVLAAAHLHGACAAADSGQGLHHATDSVKCNADGVGQSQKRLSLGVA